MPKKISVPELDSSKPVPIITDEDKQYADSYGGKLEAVPGGYNFFPQCDGRAFRRSVFSQEEFAFLESRTAEYINAQKTGSHQAFFNSLWPEFEKVIGCPIGKGVLRKHKAIPLQKVKDIPLKIAEAIRKVSLPHSKLNSASLTRLSSA